MSVRHGGHNGAAVVPHGELGEDRVARWGRPGGKGGDLVLERAEGALSLPGAPWMAATATATTMAAVDACHALRGEQVEGDDP